MGWGSKLWNYMKDNDFITYNSATPILAGKREFPEDYPGSIILKILKGLVQRLCYDALF